MASTDPGVISMTSSINRSQRNWRMDPGLKVAQVQMTLNNAASAMPVAGELNVPRSLWSRLGFNNIIAMPEIQIIKSDQTAIRAVGVYDAQSSKIMLWDATGTALPAATIGNNGALRLLVFGM